MRVALGLESVGVNIDRTMAAAIIQNINIDPPGDFRERRRRLKSFIMSPHLAQRLRNLATGVDGAGFVRSSAGEVAEIGPTQGFGARGGK